MTVMFPLGRTLSKEFVSRKSRCVPQWINISSSTLSRVSRGYHVTSGSQTSLTRYRRPVRIAKSFRSYATESVSRPAGRPKAHTGRAPAKSTKRTTTPKEKALTKEPAAKATSKAKPGPKPKAKPKAKPGPKPKPKPKPEPKPKKPKLSPAEKKEIEEPKIVRELKKKALLDSPKKLPQTAWTLVFNESKVKGMSVAEAQTTTKEAAHKFQSLSPAEREDYNHRANANKAKNEAQHKQWLSSFTPMQIREANSARRKLTRISKERKASGKKSPMKSYYTVLKDERLVKRPVSSFGLFSIERHQSGDFAGLSIVEASKLIGGEWNALDSAAKQPYEEKQKADHNRYIEEYITVYGEHPPTKDASQQTA